MSNEDIDKYLKSNSIDSSLFMKDIKSKNLKEQVCSPFYLMQLSNLFKSTGSLPEIDKLMGKLISASFDQDKNKYVNTKDIISCKREARENLEMEIEEEYLNQEDKSWTIPEVQKYIKFQSKSIEDAEDDRNQADRIIKDLVSACIKLQANSMYYGASENQRNDYIRDLMDTLKYNVKDQTRRGISYSGKEAGEIDILLKENELPVTIIEALNLSSLNAAYLKSHINKIYKYDTAGNKFNILLVYVSVNDFDTFCSKYMQYIREFAYPYPMAAVKDIKEDFIYSDIRVFKTVLDRNNYKTELYHICVLIGK